MEPKRILLADDDEDLRGLLSFFLRKQGFEVVAVGDGREALVTVEKEKFDLALLDVMMPGIDGYHVAQQLCERMGASRPKIVLMTSRNLEVEKGVALMSGADAAIQKPFKLPDVKAKIDAVLG